MLKTWEAVQKILNKEGKENFIVKQLIINMKKIFHLTFLLIVSQLTSQQTPASLTEESILFIGATAHIGNGTIIENSAIGIRNGKITEVTTENLKKFLELRKYSQIIPTLSGVFLVSIGIINLISNWI